MRFSQDDHFGPYMGAGFGQRTWFEHDSDLDDVRAAPRFQALLERLPR
jgi:hypothetical protein